MGLIPTAYTGRNHQCGFAEIFNLYRHPPGLPVSPHLVILGPDYDGPLSVGGIFPAFAIPRPGPYIFPMTYDEAIAFWFARINYEVRSATPADLKLERMRAFLRDRKSVV